LSSSEGEHSLADAGLFAGNRSITVDALNQLLHAELAAVKSYREVLDRFAEEKETGDFRDLETAHLQAADALHEHIIERGGEPTNEMPAPWLDVGAASHIEGERGVLCALQKGEQALTELYERTLLERAGVERACRRLIEEQLLLDTRGHVQMVGHLVDERRRKASP